MAQRIVVLDGETLTTAQPGERPDNGEPSWQAIESCVQEQLVVYPRTPDQQVIERAGDAELVLTNKVAFPADTIAALPRLQYIGVLATGTDIVDLEAARAQNITVTNAPGYSGASVAQHVFALLLELTNHVAAHSEAVHESQWARCPDFSFTVAPIVELAGKTLGIVGVGDIGQRVAHIGHAMGMNVAVHSRSRKELGVPAQWVALDELFEHSDVVSLHCPLNEQTRAMVNAERLASMKPSAYLINAGRGPLIDEAALAEALRSGQIAGAGLDVLSEEPPASGSPLIGAPRCIITPHNAWASRESRQRLMAIVADNIKAVLAGRPTNVVNP